MSRLSKLNNKKNNVVYERTKPEKEPFRYGGLIYSFVFLLLAAAGYLIFFSGALKINDVVVEGYSQPEKIETVVNNFRASNFLGNNILFISTTNLEKVILNDSSVRSCEARRSWPNTINIQITESTGAVVWNTVGENFILDDRGYVIENNINNSLPMVFDNANIPVALGERVASPTFIKYIIDIWDNFELVTGQPIEKIIILDILSDVHVKSKSTWTVYLDSTKDPLAQLENLNKVLQSAAESGHKNLQYIDMRLEDKVFYR